MISILNNIIAKTAAVIMVLLNLLPDSPFTWLDLTQYPGWNWVNFFIPFDAILGITVTYCSAVAIYYVVRWALRWVKYIQ